MNRDGSHIRQITSGDINCYRPKWSPDGRLISYVARARYEPDDSFKVFVVNPFKLEVPRIVCYGKNQTWKDSITLEMTYQGRQWQASLDGRPVRPFAQDSIFARTCCNGRYVYYNDVHSAVRGKNTDRVCLAEEWDGTGPAHAINIGAIGIYPNYDALYFRRGLDVYRISCQDWKTEKLAVNVQDIDVNDAPIRTTADGKEMVYKTTEVINKLGVIENLFK
jgi:hypothetical protein